MTQGGTQRAADVGRAPATPLITRKDGLDLYKIAYEEARRQVDAQLAELDRARTRAVAFLAFVGTATAFLAGTTLRGAERDTLFYWLAGIATCLFLVALVAVCELLLALHWNTFPRRFDWKFVEPSDNILKFIDQEVPPTSELQLTQLLSYQYNGHLHHNRTMLEPLRVVYAVTLICGLLQLGLWILIAYTRGAERLL